MDALDEQLAQLKLINSRPLSPRVISAGVEGCSSGSSNLLGPGGGGLSPKKVGPAVPPKPNKKSVNAPQVPQSIIVKQTCEPLYSKRLQSDSLSNKTSTIAVTPVIIEKPLTGNGRSILHRKQQNYAVGQNHVYSNIKMTLDNPAILDQQLEALEHHKKQLEKKGLMPTSLSISTVPKLTSASFMNGGSLSAVGNSAKPSVDLNQQQQEHSPHHIYSNLSSQTQQHPNTSSLNRIRDNTDPDIIYSNIMHHQNNYGQINKPLILNNQPADMVYSNVGFGGNDELPPPPAPIEMITPPAPLNLSDPSSIDFLNQISEDELPPPPSPVSSSYSELRRANDNFPKMPTYPMPQYGTNGVTCVANIGNNDTLNNSSLAGTVGGCNSSTSSINSGSSTVHPGNNDSLLSQQTYMNTSYNNDYSTYGGPTSQSFSQYSDYYGYGTLSQGSSTYESIYEPINPRPPSQLSSRSNYSLYTSYVNGPQTCSTGSRTPTMGNSASNSGIISGPGSVIGGAMHLSAPSTIPNHNNSINNNHKEAEVEALTDLLVHSMDSNSDVDSYGICVKCGDRVVGENSGCTAMDQIYHIACFTCIQCQINLQGKPFYELEDKPYCEEDYLNTLEKCSVCMKPILERILRATGKPYHPQCFTCVVCGNSLDGIPFTVDATNQNYCIEDFHKKFAPRCCVCRQPIMPEPGQEETVRVVALDRSFHFECYKCEDCGLLLSSEAEGRGCYPLDDHVLCKSCNAKRVQALTNRMTTEL